MNKLQRLYACYSDNNANSAQFHLGLGLSLAITFYIIIVIFVVVYTDCSLLRITSYHYWSSERVSDCMNLPELSIADQS